MTTTNPYRGQPDECAGGVYCPDPVSYGLGEDLSVGPACERCADLDARWDAVWGDIAANVAHQQARA